jgi:hypothetical protein
VVQAYNGKCLVHSFAQEELILRRAATDKGIATIYTRDNCLLTTQEGKGEVILTRVRSRKLYRLQMKVIIPKGGFREDWSDVVAESTTFFGASSSGNSLKLWPERFSHLHPEMILKMSREKVLTNVKLSDKKEKAKLCEGCVYRKSHRLPYPKSDKTSRAKKAREFFHSNVCGPMNI